MSTVEIRAPEEQTDGTRSQILRWLKGVGDAVVEHEPLIEIETDKVTVEVASPASGVLLDILKLEQDEVAPGEVLGRLEVAASVGAADSLSGEKHSVAVDGVGGGASRATTSGSAAAAADDASDGARGNASAALSPAVRRLIAERGLDASAVRGSGEGGRITVDDVLAHGHEQMISEAASSGKAKSEALTAASHVPSTIAKAQPTSDNTLSKHTIPHSAIRKRIADHMVQSLLQTAPHVTTVFEADMSAVIAHRAAHRADFESRGAPLTFTAYFLSASIEAIRAVPEANSRWTDTALEIYDTINIGVATALEDTGLVVPVLKNLESKKQNAKDLFEIAHALNELVTAARAGKLQPSDVRGGTFTISNHGVSGSLLATPIVINQPQAAILGIGKLERRPVVIEKDGVEQVVVRPKCYVTLTIDHRVMDGHQANRLLQTFVKTLESWSLHF
jgi:2-oxoglutarate dehydrogenase E2 component (dihydrolipoamide succinyltransferase)